MKDHNDDYAKDDDDLFPPPSRPHDVAIALTARFFRRDGVLTLRHWRGSWWQWTATHWREQEVRNLKAHVYKILSTAKYYKPGSMLPQLVDWAPNRRSITDVLDALEAVCHLSERMDQPSWLRRTEDDPPGQLIACRNGLLHLATRQLYPHTPRYFNQVAVPFEYQPDAHAPVVWLQFLEQIFSSDREQIEALQQFVGYILSGGTEQQKILMIVGPGRSGKGTIARTMISLVGAGNVAGPTLASLATNFGLSDLIGKPLAIVSDARMSTKTDSSTVVERLLSISGEDSLTIDRKYRDHWFGKLGTRFLICTNELPRFTDSSGAIANRFIILQTKVSFVGREDHELARKIDAELPGILSWALDGLDQLKARGSLLIPQSSLTATQSLADLAAPVHAFLRDETEPAGEVTCEVLYQHYRSWCEDNGRSPASSAVFGRDLQSAMPSVRRTRRDDPWSPTGKRRRVWVYSGIQIASTDQYNGQTLGPPRTITANGRETPGHSANKTVPDDQRSRTIARTTEDDSASMVPDVVLDGTSKKTGKPQVRAFGPRWSQQNPIVEVTQSGDERLCRVCREPLSDLLAEDIHPNCAVELEDGAA